KARLAQGVLHAPFDALIAERPVSVGTYVASGDLCFELLALEHREVLLDVPPQVAAAARPGASVALRSDALPGFELESTRLSMLPSPQARARTFTGVVRLEPRDDPERRLQPGMFVRAILELRAARGALVVPIDAVLEGAEGTRLALCSGDKEPKASFLAVRVL